MRTRRPIATDPAAIAAQVRAITLDALTRGSLDSDALKRVTAAVVKGAREGTAPLGKYGGQALKEAMRGLDEALAGAAEAAAQLAEHARTSGSAVGQRVKIALDQLTQAVTSGARDQAKKGTEAVRHEAALLAGLAAGLLQGIAARLESKDIGKDA